MVLLFIRRTVGRSVPVRGVRFNYSGCMPTAIAGAVLQEGHGLCGLVGSSGLFDIAAVVRHVD